jgi:hypothetical protein
MPENDSTVTELLPDDLAAIGRACFALHARMTARLLTRVYDARGEAAGLRFAQFGLLGAIAHGSATSQTSAADRLGLERTTLVRNLKFLEQKGWIEATRGRRAAGLAHRLTPCRDATSSPAPSPYGSALKGHRGAPRRHRTPDAPATPCGAAQGRALTRRPRRTCRTLRKAPRSETPTMMTR